MQESVSKDDNLAISAAKVTKINRKGKIKAEKFLPRLQFYWNLNIALRDFGILIALSRQLSRWSLLFLWNLVEQLLHQVPERCYAADLATLVLGMRTEQCRTE